MRDAFQRAGITRPSHHSSRRSDRPVGGGGKPSGPRTARAINLKRLADALEFDLLAAALGVSEVTLRNLTNDRASPQDEHSVVHITQKLQQIGMPATWLDQPNARVFPDNLTKLRRLGSNSDAKAAIRRSNLKKLVDAFPDRMELLADALELVVSGISQILDGRLEFDDQRFGHVNPRLVAAGFPDGWLELSDASLSEEMVAGLEARAVDAYEQDLTELETSPGFRPDEVEEEPAAPVAAAGQPVEIQPVVEETVEAEAASEDVAPQATPATPTTPSPATPVLRRRARKTSAAPAVQLTLLAEPESAVAPSPAIIMKEETAMPKTQAPAKKGPAIPPFAGKKPAGAPAGGGMSASLQAGLRRVGATSTRGRPAGVKAAAPAPAPVAKKVVVKKAAKAATGAATKPAAAAKPAYVRGQDKPSTERSQARADAIDRLMENSRRGAKVTLWRDFLGKSLPFAGNIRRGVAMFSDDMANLAEEALGLPNGWIDDPVFPPPSTLAAWVMDASVPLPTPKKASAGPAATKPKLVPVKGKVSMQMAPPTAANAARPPFAAGHQVVSHQMAPGVEMAAAAPVPAPAHVQAAPAVTPVAAEGFTWKPAVHPQASPEPGPLTNALSGVLAQLAKEGTFTEDDALRMINYLKSA